MIAATIAHEDQQLGTRPGAFDVEDFKARAKAYVEGKPDPSGSTIPQQLAKNIYLWPEQSVLRKALEAGLASQLSLVLTDKRILELYLNYAQFGPKLYGNCTASWYYFNTPPWLMTKYHAAQLMGVVLFPDLIQRASEGGAYVDKAVYPKTWDDLHGASNVWVPRQAKGMGGWKVAVASVGITDRASDNQAKRGNQDAGSTMPQSVRSLLNR
ncbi:biosynthetic peptidoglycan transglycosylase [Arthrobacter globiformis]|uniref:biosynthetic peptidoglycan transglycosylase n=1 Tax=Arthrobacter globiformis TaxID=1665 RepID=UPI00278F15B0|nr:biosynthetic peptidoglycan transglycosylase [Arthrobacter globiformis]MDQ0618063.1 monofunctional biosynthetic peptidoglycan transglycosylase [Arthrobacter globiformis]